MNHIIVAGHLGADPEVRFTSSGQKVTTFRVASKSRRSGKEETIWWRITVWGDQHDKMISYLKKGSPIMVMGELAKPEIYTDREGNPQTSLNVTATSLSFSPFGRSDAGQGDRQPAMQGASQSGEMNANAQQEAYQQMMQPQGSSQPAFSDDEIPF